MKGIERLHLFPNQLCRCLSVGFTERSASDHFEQLKLGSFSQRLYFQLFNWQPRNDIFDEGFAELLESEIALSKGVKTLGFRVG